MAGESSKANKDGNTAKINDVPPNRKVLTPKEFEKKVQGLKKQIYELLTLCSVPGCLIIRSPDDSKTYTWPESKDEVMKFAELYYSKKASGKKPVKHCGGGRGRGDGGGLGRVDLLNQSLKNLSVDEEKRFLKELDVKIERLKRRIESETAKKQEERLKNGTSEGSERMVLDNAELSLSLALANPIEDENEKLIRDLERVTEALKEKIKGKRKLGDCMEEEASDGRLMKEMKLSIPRVKKMLQEIEGLMTADTNNGDGGGGDDDDDDGTRLTLGR